MPPHKNDLTTKDFEKKSYLILIYNKIQEVYKRTSGKRGKREIQKLELSQRLRNCFELIQE